MQKLITRRATNDDLKKHHVDEATCLAKEHEEHDAAAEVSESGLVAAPKG